MGNITVKVLRDSAGYHPGGYDKVIPADSKVIGMQQYRVPPDNAQALDVLVVQTTQYGELYLQETKQSYMDKLNPGCCPASITIPAPANGTVITNAGFADRDISAIAVNGTVLQVGGDFTKVKADNFLTLLNGNTVAAGAAVTVYFA